MTEFKVFWDALLTMGAYQKFTMGLILLSPFALFIASAFEGRKIRRKKK